MTNAQKIAEKIKNRIEHDYDRIVIDNQLLTIIEAIIAPHLLDDEGLAEYIVDSYPELLSTWCLGRIRYSDKANNPLTAAIAQFRKSEV